MGRRSSFGYVCFAPVGQKGLEEHRDPPAVALSPRIGGELQHFPLLPASRANNYFGLVILGLTPPSRSGSRYAVVRSAD